MSVPYNRRRSDRPFNVGGLWSRPLSLVLWVRLLRSLIELAMLALWAGLVVFLFFRWWSP